MDSFRAELIELDLQDLMRSGFNEVGVQLGHPVTF